MDTITIENLIYSGIHGVYEKEHTAPQRFKITICAHTNTSSAGNSDEVSDTVDYSHLKNKVRSIIEGPRCNLIEHLSEKIAHSILEDSRIYSIDVAVSKIDIWDNGTPSVLISRKQTYNKYTTASLPVQKILEGMNTHGVHILPLLKKETVAKLLSEVNELVFNEAENVQGKHLVEQHFMYNHTYKQSGIAWEIGRDIEHTFNSYLQDNNQSCSPPLKFNEVATQKYQTCNKGISTHRDESRFINCIVIFVLQGDGIFYTSSKRDSGTRTSYRPIPGDVIFMRAPGHLTTGDRPYHGVCDITSPRISMTLRQDITKDAIDKM